MKRLSKSLGCKTAILIALVLLISLPALADPLVFTTSTDATAMVEALLGEGITLVGTPTYTGGDAASGFFTGGTGILPFESGIVLTNGSAATLVGPNDSTGTSTSLNLAGYDPLTTIANQTTYDAAVLSFSFIPTGDVLSFQFVFGSEEYNEYVGSYNDVFAFFLNGVNIALLPGTEDPVSINSVNNSQNTDYYTDNTGATLNTELDGLVGVQTTLYATGAVTPNVENTIVLAIADAGDTALDSAVFLSGSSFVPDPLSNAYDFTFQYSNGDFYTGTVYALPEYGYGVEYTQTVAVENDMTGTYTITGVTLGQDPSQVGMVYVNSYYDSETETFYTPVSNGTAAGTNYLDSEHDYIIETGVPTYLFGQSGETFYEADTGIISQYDFTYYYDTTDRGDYYTGYVYAPTLFQTDGPLLTVGTYIYDQPMEFWDKGFKSLNGGAYYITAITDGFDLSYDKKTYITSYYDANTAEASLCVNVDLSDSCYIYLPDRTVAWESGYAINGSNHDVFSPYDEVDVAAGAVGAAVAAGAGATGAGSTAMFSAAPSPSATSASAYSSQAVWTAYWNQTASLLDEERYR